MRVVEALKCAIGLIVTSSFAMSALAEEKKVVVTVVQSSGDWWSNSIAKGVQAAAKDFSIDASAVFPPQADAVQQVQIVDDLAAKKVDAIGIFPVNGQTLDPALKHAQEVGVKVITFGDRDGRSRDWNIETIDDVAFGRAEIQTLAKLMSENGDYAIIVDDASLPNEKARADAAIAYQKDYYPKMTLFRRSAAYEADKVSDETTDILRANPRLKGILALGWNGPIGVGIAVRALGGRPPSIIGRCLPDAARALIEASIINECVVESPAAAGYSITALMKLAIDGSAIKDGVNIVGLGPVTVDVASHNIIGSQIFRVNKVTIGKFRPGNDEDLPDPCGTCPECCDLMEPRTK